jgi:hypothetical protein
MNTKLLPIIQLSGTAQQRGEQYGDAVGDSIKATLDCWFQHLGGFAAGDTLPSDKERQHYLDNFFADTGYIDAIEHWAPDLYIETKAIAKAIGQRLNTVLGLQLMDEEWVYGLSRQHKRPTEKCTAFGLTDAEGDTSYAGQNMDVPAWVEGKQMLLRIAATNTHPEALVFTMAGNIGLNGLNAAGLGITCNTLAQLAPATDGLPVAFIVRSVLSMSSIDKAEDFLRTIKHASGQNYILSAHNDIRCLECCGSSVTSVPLLTTSQSVFHTNHPLVNTDLGKQAAQCAGRLDNSTERLRSISQRLNRTDISLSDIKAALSAHDSKLHPVSRRLDIESGDTSIGYTAASCIYEFSDKPKLHLAAGPPCESAYKVFEFNEYP